MLTLPIAVSHYFTASGEKNVLRGFVHLQGTLFSSCTPLYGKGPLLRCLHKPWLACQGSIPQSRSELHKLACTQLSEKSESTSLCLQGWGAAGIPSLLISQPVVYSSLPYRGLCLGGTFQVDVSCVCSLTKLTCSMQIQTKPFPLWLKSWVLVIMEMFGSSLGLSVSPSASCFGYSAQPGECSKATMLALTLPS